MKILVLILHVYCPDSWLAGSTPATRRSAFVVENPEQASMIVRSSGKGFNERSEGKLYELDLATNTMKEVRIPVMKVTFE